MCSNNIISVPATCVVLCCVVTFVFFLNHVGTLVIKEKDPEHEKQSMYSEDDET
jgi:hypothetical protein